MIWPHTKTKNMPFVIMISKIWWHNVVTLWGLLLWTLRWMQSNQNLIWLPLEMAVLSAKMHSTYSVQLNLLLWSGVCFPIANITPSTLTLKDSIQFKIYLYLHMCWYVSDLTFRKGTRYGCGEELSSWYNLLVKSSASIFASCRAIITEDGSKHTHTEVKKTQGATSTWRVQMSTQTIRPQCWWSNKTANQWVPFLNKLTVTVQYCPVFSSKNTGQCCCYFTFTLHKVLCDCVAGCFGNYSYSHWKSLSCIIPTHVTLRFFWI